MAILTLGLSRVVLDIQVLPVKLEILLVSGIPVTLELLKA